MKDNFELVPKEICFHYKHTAGSILQNKLIGCLKRVNPSGGKNYNLIKINFLIEKLKREVI
jgi:hypothetical protein